MQYFHGSLTKKFSSNLFKVILGQKVRKSLEYCKLKDSGLHRDQPRLEKGHFSALESFEQNEC